MRAASAGSGVSDRIATLAIWSAAIGVALFFLWLMGDLVYHGIGSISWQFLTEPVSDAGRAGGIGPIIASTLMILAVCLVVACPLSLGTAILLAEFSAKGEWFGAVVRRGLDVLAGVPSIVFGLFGNAFFCIYLGMGFSITSGGLTLACMVLPLLIRAAEEGLRAVPDEYRQGAAALGLSRRATLWHILLPAAIPSLVAGMILGIGRALAETAALIFTSGYVTRMPQSPWDSGRALSVHIFDLSMNVAGGDGNAYGAALVLVSILLVVNISVSRLAQRWHRRVLL